MVIEQERQKTGEVSTHRVGGRVLDVMGGLEIQEAMQAADEPRKRSSKGYK
jgi:hypothetical protein